MYFDVGKVVTVVIGGLRFVGGEADDGDLEGEDESEKLRPLSNA